jgi:hypothetical protein
MRPCKIPGIWGERGNFWRTIEEKAWSYHLSQNLRKFCQFNISAQLPRF